MARAKNIENFDCNSEPHQAALAILRARLGEMIDLQSAALDFTNIEGVHDMRVASRRLRSAMSDFEILFDDDDFRDLERSVKLTARKLGAVRDEDVAIDALEKIAAQADPEIAAGINGFIEARAVHRDAARLELTHAVTNKKLADLRDAFGEVAASYSSPSEIKSAPDESAIAKSDHANVETKDDAVGHDEGNKDATRNDDEFRQVGREVVNRRWRKLIKHAASLYRPLEPEPLHRLRIEAKRLRYALELFDACFDGKLNELSKEVAVMQSALGELHDLDVWVVTFGDVLIQAGKSAKAKKKPGTTAQPDTSQQAAALWLLDYFTKQRPKHYRVALEQWQQWQTDDFAARLTEAFGSPALSTPTPRTTVKKKAKQTKQAAKSTAKSKPTSRKAASSKTASGETTSPKKGASRKTAARRPSRTKRS
ncbi:MAG: CHAD domain-containing protein [Pyrinomonadaceae bacterium MAG19_C2-C3]|nr:CHAD domain-containing protein [Pyrinomonadaceae bacterium MAG19_C2-C3]